MRHKITIPLASYFLKFAFSLLLLGFFGSCSNLKYLKDGQQLYTGADIKLEPQNYEPGKKEKKEIKEMLEDNVRPEPNDKFLGFLRPKLWFYNIAGKPKGKGLRYFMKNKLGEPPVLLSDADPERTREILKNKLENEGHYQAEVLYEIKEKNKKAGITYTATFDQPYKIQNVQFPKGDSGIAVAIRQTMAETKLKKGEGYSLQTLKEERDRIDAKLKDQGYFYFKPDYLLFTVDSTAGERKINVYLSIKDNVPDKALKTYSINKVYIFPDFSLEADSSSLPKTDTIFTQSYYYVSYTNDFRPLTIIRSVFITPGELYTNTAYDLTLNRLMNLGAFKFVNIRFEDANLDTLSTNGALNVKIYLTPMPKRSLRLELRGVSKSNNFVGPEFNASLTNRNFLGGAEWLNIKLTAGFETLIAKKQQGVNSYNLGSELELNIPRFITPFFEPNPPTRFVPKTKIRLGYQILNRVNYFALNSFNTSFGYEWNETLTKKHELFPIDIQFLQLTKTSDDFQKLLNDNVLLQRSFERQFILSSTYAFTYNTQINEEAKKKTNNVYFNVTGDVSGNLAYLAMNTFSKENASPEDPYRLLGAPFSQYAKASTDLRYFLNAGPESKIATRLIMGAGIPYGNSSILPYIKQFYSGGNTSVRAFQARTLGPGIYKPADSLSGSFLIDQSGDIKLEGNLEYRFPIIGVFKGAIFGDAGNVWLLNDDPKRPGGQFRMNTFARQIAVGTGLGLRIDASFFVLRFDLAFPIRKPYLEEGKRWVGDDIRIGDPQWRKDNFVLNIAIGYPF